MPHPPDEDLTRYVERALPAPQRADVERHLDECEPCRQLVSVLMADQASEGSALESSPGDATVVDAAPIALRPGELIDGKYRLERVIGRGAMGRIFEAHHEALNQRVALKFIDSAQAGSSAVQRRFIREARAAARLHGPHVCRVLELGTHQGHPYLVLELLVGETLQQRQKRGAVPWQTAIGWIREACSGLEEAHALGVVHRDLKPANLFLAKVGGREVLKVLDFGMARSLNPEIDHGLGQLTVTNLLVGTPAFMAPEQYQRRQDGVGPAADLWALGVVLFQLLSGRLPFDGADPVDLARAVRKDAPADLLGLAPGTPPSVAAVVSRCLEKDAAARYPSAVALRKALDDAERDAVGARGRIARRAALAAAVVAGLVAAGGVATRQRAGEPPATTDLATVPPPTQGVEPSARAEEPAPPAAPAPSAPGNGAVDGAAVARAPGAVDAAGSPPLAPPTVTVVAGAPPDEPKAPAPARPKKRSVPAALPSSSAPASELELRP